MFALIRKDLIACRLVLAIGLAVYVLYAATTLDGPLGYLILNILTTIILTLIPIVIDDKYHIDTLVCYLPPSRRHVVLARYAMASLALITGLVLHVGAIAVFRVYFTGMGFETLCAPQAVLAFCMVPIAFTALYLPCYFRFGLGQGSFAFVVLLTALVICVTGPLVATDILSANGGFVMTRNMMQHPERILVALIDHVATYVGTWLFYATLFVGSVALIVASLASSIRFFKQRDF